MPVVTGDAGGDGRAKFVGQYKLKRCLISGHGEGKRGEGWNGGGGIEKIAWDGHARGY